MGLEIILFTILCFSFFFQAESLGGYESLAELP